MSDAYTPNILDYDLWMDRQPQINAHMFAYYRKKAADHLKRMEAEEREWAEQVAKEAGVSVEAASAVINALQEHGWG
jgi:SOS response regulatory protein OraA/RecX